MKQPSQADKLLELLSDGQAHGTPEIQRVVYGADHLGVARIASRVDDLRKRGFVIENRPGLKNKSITYYKMMNPPVPKPKVVYDLVFKEGRPVRVPRLVYA